MSGMIVDDGCESCVHRMKIASLFLRVNEFARRSPPPFNERSGSSHY
ncbi:hypothetical protein RMSM_00993 [Rhodopirellula maiorica SM1]|uniref:Uncharacterized protein n=1 Tax=Rhodopirellula maiorica SM1 TaxID=1265738 RepID=M5RS82_9BACT|nr:hypothetical protein RMSM_00993 [Rhodopirellula maiorica SM1]